VGPVISYHRWIEYCEGICTQTASAGYLE